MKVQGRLASDTGWTQELISLSPSLSSVLLFGSIFRFLPHGSKMAARGFWVLSFPLINFSWKRPPTPHLSPPPPPFQICSGIGSDLD